MKLNIGCGESKMEGYINIDVDHGVKPDLVLDVTKGPFPYELETVDEIVMMHFIEHVQKKFYQTIFEDCHAVLKPGGFLILGYPEARVCMEYWLSNFLGQREFWGHCLMGRQLTDYDHHVTLVDSVEIADMLDNIGYHTIKYLPEVNQPQYTMLRAIKGPRKATYEEALQATIFGDE